MFETEIFARAWNSGDAARYAWVIECIDLAVLAQGHDETAAIAMLVDEIHDLINRPAIHVEFRPTAVKSDGSPAGSPHRPEYTLWTNDSVFMATFAEQRRLKRC